MALEVQFEDRKNYFRKNDHLPGVTKNGRTSGNKIPFVLV